MAPPQTNGREKGRVWSCDVTNGRKSRFQPFTSVLNVTRMPLPISYQGSAGVLIAGSEGVPEQVGLFGLF